MTADFLHAFQSEWLKTKRSLASWLVIVGAFFTPAIVIVARLLNPARLPRLYAADDFWMLLWKNSWESMAIFFLPMAAILATSVVTQIEYKNNTWKQVLTLPLSPAVVFFSKLAIVLLILVQFFVLFNLGMYLSALAPYLIARNAPYPRAPLPWRYFVTQNLWYFVDCLPIVAAQYLLSLRFKNFLVPVGCGWHRTTGETARVSVAGDGTQGNADSTAPAISADGRYVVFTSAASNLVANDTNGVSDVFLHDRVTHTTTTDGIALSDDARYVTG
jgi:hypothetical protein